ncbi:SDR family oxidoreductase [Streptomyces canus]|uniref:SDR family oxidoreductase n=1 Tax=Streptomyces canus TaxID=58343 RepID=UPI00224E332E|nr:SDR family oxidoreductase [Streptomyces canus]MCX5255027.1 SDR family oxidoreductase [Streptomyces canus]
MRVDSVAPQVTIAEGLLAERGDGLAELGKDLPLWRAAEPGEIAEAILCLTSPRPSYVTSALLAIDYGAPTV